MFKRNLLKLFCLLLLTGIGSKALAVAESEPNDVWNQADVITLGATGTGTAGVSQNQDWWRVTSATDGKLTINWTATNVLYVWCEIYDTLGTLQLASNYTASNNVLNADGLAAGTYYIKFYAFYSTEAPSYSFTPTWTTPAQANDVEPNGTRNQAKVLNLNGSKTGHIGYYYNNVDDTLDWYKVTTTLDGKLEWTITSHNGQYVWAELFDNDGITELGNGNYTTGTTTYYADGLTAGTYYIRIKTFYNYEYTAYTISNNLVLPPVANDAEPNGTPAQAITFNLNDTVTGHTGYYYNHLDDSLDWYKVTTSFDGRLDFTMYSLNGQYVWLQIFDNAGTNLLSTGSTYTTTYNTWSKDGLAAGTYYFRVKTYYDYEYAPYKFIVKLVQPARKNDTEPNNTKAQAKTINPNDSITGHAGYQYNGARDTFDYRKVTITGYGKLEWTISSENGQYIFARLYDNNGTTIVPESNGNYTSTTATYFADGLAPGTYYLKMHTYYNNYNDEWVPYYLKTKFYPSGTDPEPNGTYATAKSINLNDSLKAVVGYYYNASRDTTDWFKLTTNNDGQLNIKLYGLTNNFVYLEVFDKNGTTDLFSNYTIGGTLTYSANNIGKGTYYVKVHCYYISDFCAYALVNSLVNNNPNDPEPDNYANYANKINGYTTRTGNINYRQNGGAKDVADWWSLGYYALGSLDITVNKVQHTFDANYPDILYRLYSDTTLAPLDSVQLVGGANLTYNHVYNGLSAATYYIRVTQLNNTFGGYSIKANYRDTTSQTVTLVSDVAGTTCGAGVLTYYITRGKPPYSVQLYKDGVASGAAINTSDTAKFTSLGAGYYSVTTRSTTASTYTASGKDTTIVPKPAGLATASVTTTSAILKWTGLSCVDGYRLQWRLKGTTAWTTIFQAAGATQDTLTGLAANTQYQFRVYAYVLYNGTTKYYGLVSTIKTFTTPVVRLADNNGAAAVSELEVYPNPALDKINFVVDDASPVMQITISNSIGQQVMVINNNVDLSQAVDVSSLQQGIYFVTIKTSTALYTSRFVKE